MRVKTRSGQCMTVPDSQILRQERFITRHEVYYVLHLEGNRSIQMSQPAEGVDCTDVDMRQRYGDL